VKSRPYFQKAIDLQPDMPPHGAVLLSSSCVATVLVRSGTPRPRSYRRAKYGRNRKSLELGAIPLADGANRVAAWDEHVLQGNWKVAREGEYISERAVRIDSIRVAEAHQIVRSYVFKRL